MNMLRALLFVFGGIFLALLEVAFTNGFPILGVPVPIASILAFTLLFFDREDEGLVVIFAALVLSEFFSPFRFGTQLFPWIMMYALVSTIRRRFLLETTWWVKGVTFGIAGTLALLPSLLITQTAGNFFRAFLVYALLGSLSFFVAQRFLPRRKVFSR